MKPLLQRRQFSVALAGLGLYLGSGASSGWSSARAQDSALPVPDSLLEAAAAATRQGEPLVLMVSLHNCPYCELVRRNYLLPARANGVQVWQINMHDKRRALVGFDGSSTTAADQISRWKIRLAPTVLFLGAHGSELAQRLVGLSSEDFYGAYLDERIATARQAQKALRQTR